MPVQATSECLWKSYLLQNDIGPNRSFDFVVNHKLAICYLAMPDFVIALAIPGERAAVFPKDVFKITRVILCHQVATLAYSNVPLLP
jgi:hypothetical protein